MSQYTKIAIAVKITGIWWFEIITSKSSSEISRFTILRNCRINSAIEHHCINNNNDSNNNDNSNINNNNNNNNDKNNNNNNNDNNTDKNNNNNNNNNNDNNNTDKNNNSNDVTIINITAINSKFFWSTK